jgi:hypothetical protein
MGQTKKTENPKIAIDIFLEREFPQLLNCKNKPHEAVLVPDSYIYKTAAKVFVFFGTTLNTASLHILNQEQQTNL